MWGPALWESILKPAGGRAVFVAAASTHFLAAGVSPAGLEHVLDFMYTAKLTLSPENVEDVLAVATFLQMQEVVQACNTLRALSAPAGLEIAAVAGRALSHPWVRFPLSPQTLGLSERKPSSKAGPRKRLCSRAALWQVSRANFSGVFACRLCPTKGGIYFLEAIPAFGRYGEAPAKERPCSPNFLA